MVESTTTTTTKRQKWCFGHFSPNFPPTETFEIRNLKLKMMGVWVSIAEYSVTFSLVIILKNIILIWFESYHVGSSFSGDSN